MYNYKLESYKIKRELARNGISVVFYRPAPNKWGTNTPEEMYYKDPLYTKKVTHKGEEVRDTHDLSIGMITGLFHSNNNTDMWNPGEGSTIRVPPSSALLCLYEDANILDLRSGDYCFINKQTFTVQGLVNPQELNIFLEVLLERKQGSKETEYQYGTNK